MDIRATLSRYGYTVNSLARKHGVGQSGLNQLVTGNPTAKKMQDLADMIGCKRWEFFLDEIKSDPQGAERLLGEIRAAGEEDARGKTEDGRGKTEEAGSGGERRTEADDSRPDLITVDPATGESRRYRLMR